VNEQQMSGEQEISRVNDILHLQAMKATYCKIADACVNDGGKAAARLAELFTEDVRADYGMGPLQYLDEFRRTQQGWRISSIRFIQEG